MIDGKGFALVGPPGLEAETDGLRGPGGAHFFLSRDSQAGFADWGIVYSIATPASASISPATSTLFMYCMEFFQAAISFFDTSSWR
jgi:hypothetical protein